jgi:hypothetical protein
LRTDDNVAFATVNTNDLTVTDGATVDGTLTAANLSGTNTGDQDLSGKADKATTYTETEVDGLLGDHVALDDPHTQYAKLSNIDILSYPNTTLASSSDISEDLQPAIAEYPHIQGFRTGTGTALTFAQSVAEAAERGARLLTVQELEAGVVTGAGFGYDTEITWTSSSAGVGLVYGNIGSGDGTRVVLNTSTDTAAGGYAVSVVGQNQWTETQYADKSHKARHQNGGADEIDVAGLSGLLAEDQHVLDAEAVSAMGVKADANPLHHDRYTDAEAIAAVGDVADASITQAKLKTSTHEQSTNSDTWAEKRLTYADYGFNCRLSTSGEGHEGYFKRSDDVHSTTVSALSYVGESVWLKSVFATIYVIYRYVTSSGEVFWVWLLRDKETGIITDADCCSDHCGWGLEDPNDRPHPFNNYDPEKHEILLFNPTSAELTEILAKKTRRRSVLQIILEDYVPEEVTKRSWPSIPVTFDIEDDNWEEKLFTGKEAKIRQAVIKQVPYVKMVGMKKN